MNASLMIQRALCSYTFMGQQVRATCEKVLLMILAQLFLLLLLKFYIQV